jgi:tripartite-type tricarboxylate transporter receptor subunit TctC
MPGKARVIPGRATDLGLARDRRLNVPKSAKADLGGFAPSRNDGRAARFMRCLILLLASVVAIGPALAQPARWPERPIRFIVPFTAGSSSDIVGRIVGQKLGERLGSPFVIENRPGGGGMIATDMVARAEADGHVLGLANTSTHAVAASTANVPYDPVKDFAPVALLGSSPFLLALYPGLPAQNVPELIALAKAKPRTLSYASAGPATLAHLSGALFEKMAQIEMTHVPYRGTAQSTVDLMEGRVDMQFGTIPPTLAHVRSGKLRALAVTGATRNPALPEVPTIAESGLPGYESSLWQAIVAPAATPPAIVARLNREVAAVLDDADVRAAFAQHGVEPEPGSPQALGQRIRADVAKWRAVMVGAGIQ